MKKIINITTKTLFILFIGFAMSCGESFLDINPKQSTRTENALLTLNDYKAAIIGVYEEFQSSNYYGRYFPLLADIMSDDVKPDPGVNRGLEFAEYAAAADHFIPEGMFANFYQAIEHTNRIILTDIEVNNAVLEEYNNIKGEAYALRGIAYFDAVRMFAQHYTYTADASHLGIPIVLGVDDGTIKPARNTVAEVYNQVISDLTTAIPLLTLEPDNSSRMSAAAVKAILARVYLYMEDWGNAEDYASQVIADPGYSLVSNANYLDIYNTDNCSESLFEIEFTSTDNNGTDCLAGMYHQAGYGDYLPSDDLLNLFPAGDARLQAYVTDNGLPPAYGNTRVNKYPDPIGTDNTKVIRLAEVYLIRAEANYHLGNETEAQNDVDIIRKRALPTAPDVTETGTALLDEILLERRLELCFEGGRVWDIMRYKHGFTRVDSQFSTKTVTYPSEKAILPIPQYEMENNPNMQQNPGY